MYVLLKSIKIKGPSEAVYDQLWFDLPIVETVRSPIFSRAGVSSTVPRQHERYSRQAQARPLPLNCGCITSPAAEDPFYDRFVNLVLLVT